MRRFAVILAGLAALGMAEGKIEPGAYCPLPEGDEPPACLQPATQDYAEFFTGLRDGTVNNEALARVESDLAGENRYQALSTLVYGYYVLSQRAVLGKAGEVELASRLEHWNELLGDTYENASDKAFRAAMRDAVGDLEERAPAIPVRCADSDGNITQCQSTAAVADAITDSRDRTGVRGAVGRLLQRFLGIFGG
jgi:hypothetical protein